MKIVSINYRFIVIFLISVLLMSCSEKTAEISNNIIDGMLKQAEVLIDENTGNPHKLIDSANTLSSKINYNKGLSRAAFLKGKIQFAGGRYEDALKLYRSAINIAESAGSQMELGEYFFRSGVALFRLRKHNEAIDFFKKSAAARESINDSTGLGAALHNVGFLFWDLSKFDSALVYYEAALKIREKLPDKDNLASTLNSIGTVYYQWSTYDRSLEYYFRSLNITKEIGSYKTAALTLSNIGLVYNETNQLEKAKEHYRESLVYAEISRDTNALGYAYHCLGTANKTSDKDSALFFYGKSLENYKAINNNGGIIIALKGIGELYLDDKEYKNAHKTFSEILNLAELNNIPLRIAEAYKYLGEISYGENKLPAAEEYFKKSIKLSETLNNKLFLRDSYKYLSKIYERTGNVLSALHNLKEYNNYKYMIEDEDMQRRVQELKNKFEFEKYQREIQAQLYENERQKNYLLVTYAALFFVAVIAIILYRTNKKTKNMNTLLSERNELIEGQRHALESKNKDLVESNEAKDKLFSIIAHDLRSPFSTLISFSTFLNEDFDELTEEEKKGFISDIESTIKNTYQLLENLLNLSASRTGKIDFSPAPFSINELTGKTLRLLTTQAKKKSISLINNVDAASTVNADKFMIETVLRNLISNAIKYTRHGGTIEISSKEMDDKIKLFVKDNGIGMDEATRNNLFSIAALQSRDGTDGERGTGLGLGLCKEFVEKNNGTIAVESEPGNGSVFYFSLPKTN